MSDQKVTREEIDDMVETLNTFSKMVRSTESFAKSNATVQLAMKCAREVEEIYSALKDKRLQFSFIQRVCETLKIEEDTYDISVMQYACDTIVQTILTSNSVQSPCVLSCLNSYLEVCGSTRLIQLLSAIVVQSEACRVLLDFIGTIENDSHTSVIFQASLLLKVLTAKGSEASLSNTIYNWLNSNGKNRVHIVFQAISEAGLHHDISRTLIKGLISVLDDRREAAVLYWSTVISSPVSICVLKESRSLVYASLDFLSKSAEHFKQTPQFKWVSHEDGPCQEINFEMIVTYITFLGSADKSIKPIVNTFIKERCSLPGCMFWEDVQERFLT